MSQSIYSGVASNLRAGVVSMMINGEVVDVVGDCVYNPSTVKRTTLVGQSGVTGFTEMPVQGKIAATLRDADTMTVASLNAMRSVPVVVNLINGKTVSGDGMWSTEVDDVNTQEGTVKVTFEGPQVTET